MRFVRSLETIRIIKLSQISAISVVLLVKLGCAIHLVRVAMGQLFVIVREMCLDVAVVGASVSLVKELFSVCEESLSVLLRAQTLVRWNWKVLTLLSVAS